MNYSNSEGIFDKERALFEKEKEVLEARKEVELMLKDIELAQKDLEYGSKDVSRLCEKKLSENQQHFETLKRINDEWNQKVIDQQQLISQLNQELQNLQTQIMRYDGATLISAEIKNYTDLYGDIQRNVTREQYDRFKKAKKDYLRIEGLINTYDLSDKFHKFRMEMHQIF